MLTKQTSGFGSLFLINKAFAPVQSLPNMTWHSKKKKNNDHYCENKF